MQLHEKLEEEYARYVGTKYAVAVNSGTAALHLALLACGIGKGDEVIVPEYTMIACAWAVTYTGAKPVFVDCGDDLLINVKKIESKVTQKTKAIMPVHIYGRVCDMLAIDKIAVKHHLRIIEDCCEAQGAQWKNKPVGSLDVGVFSFYRNKIVFAEEGGIITTSDERIYKKAKLLKNMSFGEDHSYLHSEIGFNYRMPDSQAFIASRNLETVNLIQQNRYKVQGWYDKYLSEAYKMPTRQVVWVYDIHHPKPVELVKYLNSKGINARQSFKPMSMQPMYLKKNFEKLKAYKLSQEICYLPVDPAMTEGNVKNICAHIDAFSQGGII